ncbi:MAG: HNH endonuclease [Saprospiraceae bacterium]|nr:MAG: HNH endonuclease [Saprospiraceae bacterium]
MGKRRVRLPRSRVKIRANYCCEYCKSQENLSSSPFSIDHIIPLAKNGSNDLDNLALACPGCNNHKFTHTEALDPVSGEIVPLFHPRQQEWAQHFKWSSDYSTMIGLTPTGRVTIIRLKLNRDYLVNLRKALFLTGQQPPF